MYINVLVEEALTITKNILINWNDNNTQEQLYELNGIETDTFINIVRFPVKTNNRFVDEQRIPINKTKGLSWEHRYHHYYRMFSWNQDKRIL